MTFVTDYKVNVNGEQLVIARKLLAAWRSAECGNQRHCDHAKAWEAIPSNNWCLLAWDCFSTIAI